MKIESCGWVEGMKIDSSCEGMYLIRLRCRERCGERMFCKGDGGEVEGGNFLRWFHWLPWLATVDMTKKRER